jgi:hypothetical protein
MPNLSLSFLGTKRVLLDGAPVETFTYNKALALLAYLVVLDMEGAQGRILPIEQIIELAL